MLGRGRAQTSLDPDNPSAWGTCDRCGVRTNLRDLKYQSEWQATRLMTLKIRCCERCLDTPAPFRRTVIVGRDPAPLTVIRPEFVDGANANYRVTEDINRRTTEADDPRILDET